MKHCLRKLKKQINSICFACYVDVDEALREKVKKQINSICFACYVDVDEALREKVKKTNKQCMLCMLCGCR